MAFYFPSPSSFTMNGSVQLGAQTLISLGTSYGDVAALVQHGRLVANWLRTETTDQELFESISEVYGEVLRRRGLVDPILMNNQWSAQWHFVYRGQKVNHTDNTQSSKNGELPSFSWLMTTIVVALDLCLTSSEIQVLLSKVFVQILDRDDFVDLSEALNIQLCTNIESWRSTACIRGLVVPIQTAMKDCLFELTGTRSMLRLSLAEKEEMSELLVWLLAGITDKQHVLSAGCLAVMKGLKVAGIKLKIGDKDDVPQGRPILYYVVNEMSETGLLDVLESDVQDADALLIVPPQQVSFTAENPAEMIEAFRRPIPVKNRMALCWAKGAAAAQKVSLKCYVQDGLYANLYYSVESFDKTQSRWSPAVLELADYAFPKTSQLLCKSIHDLFGEDAKALNSWLGHNLLMDDVNSGEGISNTLVMDLTEDISADELDRFACFQALVYGYWYALLEQLICKDFMEGEIYFSTFWGWRDHRLLSAILPLNRNLCKSGGISRADVLQLLALMYAGRRMAETLLVRKQLVGLVGKVSLISLSLLRTSDDPNVVSKIALVSMPILDLLPDRDGALYTAPALLGLHRSGEKQPMRICIKPASRTWSIHPKMKFEDGRIDSVVMVARCDGRLVGTFSPDRADIGIVSGAIKSERAVHDAEDAIDAYEVTEDLLYSGSLWMVDEKVPQVIQSHGNVAMRYLSAALSGDHNSIVLISGKHGLRSAHKELQQRKRPGGMIIC